MVTTTLAENIIPFSEWLEAQSAVAEQAVVQDVPLVAEGEPLVPFSPIGVGSRGDGVVRLQEKLIELGFLIGKADGIFGAGTEAAVKTVQKALGWEETGVIQTADELETIFGIAPGDGTNLAVGTSDEWSEWMAPEYNAENKCFTVAYAYLGEKSVGDLYTCQVEIEFSSVYATTDIEDDKQFGFCSQGKVDDDWKDWGKRNVWNRSLVAIDEVPIDGVYRYVVTQTITEPGVKSSKCEIGFRCDYWASGQFRVRCVKVEKGIVATAWSSADSDLCDGINLVMETSNEWSEWMIPEYNAENRCFTISTAYLGDKRIGEPYTCQVEIEFSGVSATIAIEDEKRFGFCSQGKVDDDWKNWSRRNVWNRSLIAISEVPTDGVYRYVATQKITELGVDSNKCEIGFRCDYWASGQFRVRCIKVEKGMVASDWTPAP